MTPSCPFPQYTCSSFAPNRAVAHLVLFNVKEFIAISHEVKTALADQPAFQQKLVIEPYVLYDVLPGDGHYVIPLPFQPVVANDADWKRLAYAWFQRPSWLEVPLIFLAGRQRTPAGALPFHGLEGDPAKIPFTGECRVVETMQENEIWFETTCPGRPHLVKVSYHPKWRVEGADTIYLASPAFMLVYPTTRQVRLVFGNRWPDYVGWVVTAAGLAWLIADWLAFPLRKRYSQPPQGKPTT